MATTRPLMFVLLALLAAAPAGARPPDGRQVMATQDASDHVSDELDREIVQRVAENIETLRSTGQFRFQPKALTGLTWPMGPIPGIGSDWSGISNFVDLNPAFPNQVREYTCGTRSYDNAEGYNHRGIDYFIWPFPWHLMDTGAVDVIAAAPGILIEKRDGASDRSCSFNSPDNANYVIILHSDGTIARYLHMKRNSVTALPIGTQVAAGTVLGKVGSSGISTGPHLHFELRATNAVNAAVVDPYNGQCNAVNTAWASQRPYRDTRLNRISSHSAVPVFPQCPNTTDVPNFKDVFNPGDPITFVAAYRDLGRGMVTQFRLLRPNGTVHDSWTFDMAEEGDTPPFYSGAYWYWNKTLPANAALGLWTLEATLQGQVSRHTFRVGTTVPASGPFPNEVQGSWFNAATSGQGFTLEMVDDKRFILFFYGFGNAGEQLWLYGDYDPGRQTFGYGQPIDVPMYFVTGATWNNFTGSRTYTPWGNARITFQSCRAATVQLAGTTGTQTLTLGKLQTPLGLTCP